MLDGLNIRATPSGTWRTLCKASTFPEPPLACLPPIFTVGTVPTVWGLSPSYGTADILSHRWARGGSRQILMAH